MQRTLSGFQSLSEFLAANNACGPDAETVALAQAGEPLTGAQETAIMLRDKTHGWFNNGEPLSSIYNDLTQIANIPVGLYIPYSDAPNLDQLHTALKTFAGIQPIVVQVLNAQALLDNEQNVHSHFVCVGGIDSLQGYLTANGDDILALQGHATYPGRWQTWDRLVAAQICGLIVVKAHNTMGIPAGWSDDGTTLTAPNGHTVTHAFRDHILNYPTGWPTDNVPLVSAIPYNANSGQFFTTTILYWDGTQVEELATGSEAWRWYQVAQSGGLSITEKSDIRAAISKVQGALQIAVTDATAALNSVV